MGAANVCGGTGATCGPPFTYAAGQRYGYCVPAFATTALDSMSPQRKVTDSKFLAKKSPILTTNTNSSDSCSPNCPPGSCGWSGGAANVCGGTSATCGPPFTWLAGVSYGYCVP